MGQPQTGTNLSIVDGSTDCCMVMTNECAALDWTGLKGPCCYTPH